MGDLAEEKKSSTDDDGTMASSDDSASKDRGTGTGAAEEPEPEPELSNTSSSASRASYDPADYQKPHPDDRGGGGGKKGGATKPRVKAKHAPADKARGEDTDDSAKAKSPLSLDHCANCGVESDELRKCKQCGVVAYCGEACQKVSRRPRATTTRRLALLRRACRAMPSQRRSSLLPISKPPEALAVRPQDSLQGLRPRRHRPRAA